MILRQAIGTPRAEDCLHTHRVELRGPAHAVYDTDGVEEASINNETEEYDRPIERPIDESRKLGHMLVDRAHHKSRSRKDSLYQLWLAVILRLLSSAKQD